MAFAPRKKQQRREVWEDPELVPFIDMLVVCCCFLLMSASLLQTAVFEIALPPERGPLGSAEAPSPGRGELTLALFMTDQGLRLGGVGARAGFIPKERGAYDWEELASALHEVKRGFPQQRSITIVSEPEIIYDDVITAIDLCVAEGLPDVAVGDLRP